MTRLRDARDRKKDLLKATHLYLLSTFHKSSHQDHVLDTYLIAHELLTRKNEFFHGKGH